MPDKILSYLVPPRKNDEEEPEPVQGTTIPRKGSLFSMLKALFTSSEKECQIPIRFVMAPDGSQNNPVRAHLLELLETPTLARGRVLAERLREFTTGKSGLGLLFLMIGRADGEIKAVLSRFPAEEGVLAEATPQTLEVEFVERIFMKNARSYKAALYKDTSLHGGFWSGYAIDKQIKPPHDQLAHYWIKHFLASDFKTTSKAGTKRLAIALRQALRQVKSLSAKEAIVASVVLGRSLEGHSMSVNDFLQRFGITGEAAEAIRAELPTPTLAADTFIFDLQEFEQHVPLRSVELDNGGVLTAPSDRFDQCFAREVLSESDQRVRFTTVGRIIDQKLKGR